MRFIYCTAVDHFQKLGEGHVWRGRMCTAQNLTSGAKPDVRGEDSNTALIIEQQTSLAEMISVETWWIFPAGGAWRLGELNAPLSYIQISECFLVLLKTFIHLTYNLLNRCITRIDNMTYKWKSAKQNSVKRFLKILIFYPQTTVIGLFLTARRKVTDDTCMCYRRSRRSVDGKLQTRWVEGI